MKRRINQRAEEKEIFVQCNLERDKGTGSTVHPGIEIASMDIPGAHNLAECEVQGG